DLRYHVHERSVAPLAEHPFPVTGHREFTLSAGAVGDLEPGELDGGVRGDVNAKLGDDPVLGMFEHAVAEAVTGDVGVFTACRQRRRRPEVAGFLVAEI